MKRKLYLKILLLFLALPAFAGTTTLTGKITDAQGSGLTGTLVMQLPVPAQDPTTGSAIQPTPVYFKLLAGSIVAGPVLYDVNTINPSGLYYSARAYDVAGNLVFYGNYIVSGGTFNLGAAIPTSVTTSNISYATPATLSGNNTFTGSNQFPFIISATTTPAQTGWLILAATDLVNWRNVGNTADLSIGAVNVSATDFISVNGMQMNSGTIQSSSNSTLTITPTQAASGAGQAVTINATNAASGSNNGGSVLLTPGTGAGGGSNGRVLITHGIGGGNGVQHLRTASCTTGAGAGSTCNTTITWAATFDNTNYTAVCTVSGGTGAVTGTPYLMNTSSKTTTTMVATIVNLTAVASSGTLDCIAFHD